MNDKFKYAPGMPGFGTKGSDGSMGSQGLAMYFTDLDPVSDINSINSRIANSFDLWQNSGNPLPDGRSYVTGDLFFDSNGKAYEINAETDTFTSLGGSLNMGGFFVPLGINSDNGFQRYFNSNSTPKYIIDNIYTDSGAINYTESPINIYGIIPENFARVEYSNVEKIGSQGEPYNPFTVYSSGESVFDDASAIAIVRDASHNLFRIGNIDDAGNLRNISLIFDVSSLIHTKQPGNTFSLNSPLGSILTNYEIAANTIFDPNFNSNPPGFVTNMGTVDVSVSWTLLEFTNDPAVTGDLYFYEDLFPVYNGSTFRIDSSVARPLIFSNVGASGKIRITGISSTKAYGCYMKLSKNGWTRNSVTKSLFASQLAVTPLVLTDVSAAAIIVGYNVITNVPWTVDLYNNPGGFMSISSCPSGGNIIHPYDGSVYIALTSNLSSMSPRTGNLNIANVLGGTSQNVSVQQRYGIQPPSTPTIIENFYQWYPQQFYTYPGQTGVTYTTEIGKSSYVWTVSDGSIIGPSNTNQITVTWNSSPDSYTGQVTVHYTDGGGVSNTTIINPTVKHQIFMTPASPRFFSTTTGNPCSPGLDYFTVFATPGHQWYADVPAIETWAHINGGFTRYPFSGTVSGTGSAQLLTIAVSAGHGFDSTVVTAHSIVGAGDDQNGPIVVNC